MQDWHEPGVGRVSVARAPVAQRMAAVTVTTLAGGRALTVEDLAETVGGLKRQIQAKCGAPRFQQRLPVRWGKLCLGAQEVLPSTLF